MKLQQGCNIGDNWVPNGESTGFVDVNGKELKTGDWVKLLGCKQDKAVIGKTIPEFLDRQPKWLLFFGSENGSVQWFLNERKIQECCIEKVEVYL